MLAKVGKSWQKIEEKCPRASFCLPCSGLAAAAALGKVRPLWLSGFSQPAAVFRLGGLWWPKSLCSKATHTPAILVATRATLPAPDLSKAGEERKNV